MWSDERVKPGKEKSTGKRVKRREKFNGWKREIEANQREEDWSSRKKRSDREEKWRALVSKMALRIPPLQKVEGTRGKKIK